MKLLLASDHGGYQYKKLLLNDLKSKGHEVKDLGVFSEAASDYPDQAEILALALQSGEGERGILVCGSGVGVSVAANKFKGIRAALCHDTYSAHQGVEHDDMNVLCIGQRVVGIELARDIVFAFLGAVFSGEERHVRRLNKVKAIEERNMNR